MSGAVRPLAFADLDEQSILLAKKKTEQDVVNLRRARCMQRFFLHIPEELRDAAKMPCGVLEAGSVIRPCKQQCPQH